MSNGNNGFARAIHFGIYPDQPEVSEPGFEVEFLSMNFHTDPEVEVEASIVGIDNVRIFVSGSWACWGPADQASDGDISLHILVQTDRCDAQHVWDLYQAIEHRIVDGRMLDYATITTEVHSEQTHVVTFLGGDIFVYETKTVDAISLTGSLAR